MTIPAAAPGATPAVGLIQNHLGTDLEFAVNFAQSADVSEIRDNGSAGGLIVARTYLGTVSSTTNFFGTGAEQGMWLTAGLDGPCLRITSDMAGPGLSPWMLWQFGTEVAPASDFTVALTFTVTKTIPPSGTHNIFIIGTTRLAIGVNPFSFFVDFIYDDTTGVQRWKLQYNSLAPPLLRDRMHTLVLRHYASGEADVIFDGANLGAQGGFGATAPRNGLIGFGQFIASAANTAQADVGCAIYSRRLWSDADAQLFNADPYALWRAPIIYKRLAAPHAGSFAGHALGGARSTRGATLEPRLSVAGRSIEPRTSEATHEHH